MKFSCGAWMTAKGVTPAFVRRVTHVATDEGGQALLITGVDRNGTKGSDRFEGTVLQMRVSSPMADVIRVQVRHHHPTIKGAARFDLDYSLRCDAVRIDQGADDVSFTSGQVTLRVRKTGSWETAFETVGTSAAPATITGGGRESLGYMKVDGAGSFVTQRLSLGVGECIYGMGERFGPLVRNGQHVEIWNEDGGTVSDLAYKNIPFYLSSRGYGLLVNSTGKVDFEVGTERVSQMQFSVPGEELDYYLFYDPDPKAVLEKYTRLSGRPALPPAWASGLWLSTSFTTNYDERTVNDFVDGMLSRGIPLKVFHFDCFWMKERHWCDFEWDRDAFPDPHAMLRRLKAKGLNICLWINPYISQLSKLFEEGRDGGYFLKRSDGSVYQADQWQPGMAYVDFTNPRAVRWYQSKLRPLLDMGVDAFKTDFGERIPDDAVYHDGSDPKLCHNYYPYLYNKAVFELLEEHHGKGQALVFARSATVGCQKFPVHWGGDCEATFESMAENLRGGLSFCLSGGAFWSHDIGGFSGTATPALYKRWVAFGLLSSHSRLHGSDSYRVPWLFDEEAVKVLRHFAQLKNRLFPYLYAAAHDAVARGWPVMRPMVLEFPNDMGCLHLDRQYMLGSSLLVAPVFRQDGVAEFYLPEGRWTDLLTNRIVDGGRWQREKMDFLHLPLLARENSIIPTSEIADQPTWTAADELELHVFELADGAEACCRVVASDRQEVVASFRCRREGSRLSLVCDAGGGPGVRHVTVVVHNRAAADVVNGSVIDEGLPGAQLAWTDVSSPLVVTLAAGGGTRSRATPSAPRPATSS